MAATLDAVRANLETGSSQLDVENLERCKVCPSRDAVGADRDKKSFSRVKVCSGADKEWLNSITENDLLYLGWNKPCHGKSFPCHGKRFPEQDNRLWEQGFVSVYRASVSRCPAYTHVYVN